MYDNLATNIFTTDDWIKVSGGGTILNPYPTVQNATMTTVFDIPALDEQVTPKGETIPVPSTEGFFGDLARASQKTVPSKKKTSADVIADAIHVAVDEAGTTPDNSPKPTNATAGEAIGLIGTIKDSLLGTPDVDTLNGEINLTWNNGTKQVILICFSGREPLIHHHQHIKGKPSKHGIEKATQKVLVRWLGWLHE